MVGSGAGPIKLMIIQIKIEMLRMSERILSPTNSLNSKTSVRQNGYSDRSWEAT